MYVEREGVAVNSKDIFNGRIPKERRGLGTRVIAAVLGRTAEHSRPTDTLLELASVDMWVDFCEDRLEYRRRLGSKHGVIPYGHVRAVTLQQQSPASISVGETTFETSHAYTKKMILNIDTRRGPLVFDFRSEPIELVQQALDIVKRRPAHADRSDVPTAHEAPASRVDQLAKLVELRDAGVLTADQFEREKTRLLDE
jgi:hypothetical protein